MNNKIHESEFNIRDIYRIIEQSIPQKKIAPNKGRHSDCFVYILDGKTKYTFDNRAFTALPNDILYLAKNSAYQMEVLTDNYQVIVIDFDFDIPECTVLSSDLFQVSNYKDVETLFRKSHKKWLFKRPAYRIECKALLYSIYADIVSHQAQKYMPSSKRKKLEPALNIISKRYMNSLTIDELACACGISEGHFRRIFKEVYGVSPVQHLTLLRIKEAKELLKYEGMSTKKISESLGFKDVYYFYKTFKIHTGLTPTEYKNMLTQKLQY